MKGSAPQEQWLSLQSIRLLFLKFELTNEWMGARAVLNRGTEKHFTGSEAMFTVGEEKKIQLDLRMMSVP